MSKILQFCLSLGLLATFVHADIEALKARLNEMATFGTFVAGEFRPYKDQFVDQGASGFICDGERVYDEKPVALKFMQSKEASEREFAMYSYLQAMEKPETLERFGFADVYYYTEWEGYYLLVLSHFDGGYLASRKPFFKRQPGIETINGLVLFRNFVRQSKYMHSHGIRHDNICPDNIMLRKSQTFLINFNCGSRMFIDNHQGSPKYAARAYHSGQIRTALSDWESFLYTMCDLYDIQLHWLPYDMSNAGYLFYKNMPERIMKTIETSVQAVHLRTVFLEFANEIFTKNHSSTYPDYDHFEKLIDFQLGKLPRNKSRFDMFSWIAPEWQFVEFELILAKGKLDIEKEIKFPKPLDFKTYKYPTVNTKHFTTMNFSKSVSAMIKTCVEGSMPTSKRKSKSLLL